jgi:hypothetical protein
MGRQTGGDAANRYICAPGSYLPYQCWEGLVGEFAKHRNVGTREDQSFAGLFPQHGQRCRGGRQAGLPRSAAQGVTQGDEDGGEAGGHAGAPAVKVAAS